MFDDEFIESLPNDLIEAGCSMCMRFFEIDRGHASGQEPIDEYLGAYAAIETLAECLNISFREREWGGDRIEDIQHIRATFNQVSDVLNKKKTKDVLSNARDKFKTKFGAGFLYRFSDGDLKRIQALLNELRDLIKKSELFDAKHKERILTKLERLQSELHKQMSSLDKFWGLIGEGGVVLGKFGKDAKPFVDRIREIAQIVWRTQAISEELPSGTSLPLLTNEDLSKKDEKI